MYNQAHELARAIKESQEYKDYKHWHEIVMQDEKNKAIVDDYHQKAMALQMQMMGGKEPDEKALEEIRSLESIVTANATIRSYLEAEMRMLTAYADVQKIISEPLDLPLVPKNE